MSKVDKGVHRHVHICRYNTSVTALYTSEGCQVYRMTRISEAERCPVLLSPSVSAGSAADLSGRPRGEDAAESYSDEPTVFSGCSYGGDRAAAPAASELAGGAPTLPAPLLLGVHPPACVWQNDAEHVLRVIERQRMHQRMCKRTSCERESAGATRSVCVCC